jgi:hypothetical protein
VSMNSNELGPLSRVQRGMHVVDASGEDVGKVDVIHMGDPEAATTAGNETVNATPLDRVAEALGADSEPDVPEPLRSRLIRSGYIKVDGAHLLDADRYVPGKYVRSVADDRVQLSVRRSELIG